MRTGRVRMALVALPLLAVAACRAGAGAETGAPVVVSFTASPSAIEAGQATRLEWSVTGATTLSIEPGIGPVTGTSVDLTPPRTTTYVLIASGPGGTATASATVTVSPAHPVIASFTANPASIDPGGTSVLSWSVTGATTLSIEPGVGTVSGASVAVTPPVTTTYTLTAAGPGGIRSATATVTVSGSPPPFLEVACSGANCGAESPTRYSGTGVGIWRYRNGTATPQAISISIEGLRSGQKAVLAFSNGGATGTSLPTEGILTSPPAPNPAALDAAVTTAHEFHPGHADMVDRNRALTNGLLAMPRGPLRRETQKPASLLSPPRPTPVPGESRTWVDVYPSPPVTYTAVVRAVCALPTGRSAVFWVDPSAWDAGQVTDADLAYFESTFCGPGGGYDRVVTLLGDVWGPAAAAWGDTLIQDPPGGLQDVNVVFLGVPPTTGWAGYYWSGNSFRSAYASNSNEALAFFLNAYGVQHARGFMASALLHEFTHMVNFYQRPVVRALSQHETWLEETSALMTEDLFTPAVTPDHSVSPLVPPYLRSGGAVSLVNWVNLDGGSYGLAGSFGAFLDRRYGFSPYVGILECPDTGSDLDCVDRLIREGGGAGFVDEFDRCGASVFGLLPAIGIPSGYGYPETVLDGLTLVGLDVSASGSLRPETATSLGPLFTATTHTYFADAIFGATYARTDVVVPPASTLLLVIQ